jgi:hypothetical protein
MAAHGLVEQGYRGIAVRVPAARLRRRGVSGPAKAFATDAWRPQEALIQEQNTKIDDFLFVFKRI